MFYKILDSVNFPKDLKELSIYELQNLCDDIRNFMIDNISKTGGHLGAGLGVVELSVAMHYVFNAPIDKIIWDIGHQSYPHKILTGRKNVFETLRQKDGISGFCSIAESEYDVFGAGHSSTSISAGLGIAKARDLKGENFSVVSVIGDGAMTAGMAYEAMNNASELNTKIIVILNDNEMSISPAVGALSKYLSRLITSNKFLKMREIAKKSFAKLPKISSFFKNTEAVFKDVIVGGNWFEAMGFYYIGPCDGHDLSELIQMFERIKNIDIKKPILFHIKTEKGRGYLPAKDAKDKLHGVLKFDIETGEQIYSGKSSFTDVFSNCINQIARKDDKIVSITAGMLFGTGLEEFSKEFPNRFFDVAIAEQHAVTFAAGLAISGFKPFVAIYSTFLQRAYDQVIHDVCLQNLPVRFLIDRVGFVGPDGATHAGSFDISHLISIPNMTIISPSSGLELALAIKFAVNFKTPLAIRYPKGLAEFSKNVDEIEEIEIGKAVTICDEDREFLILSCGDMLKNSLIARDLLDKEGIKVDIFDARFLKPIDKGLITKKRNKIAIFTIEDGVCGGFGSCVSTFALNSQFSVKVYQIFMKDMFIEHSTIEDQREISGLSPEKIVNFIKDKIL